ncbi:MAG: S-methyl-5-thioribose-1-phosphate isomerase [Candidatus Omnitrophota bacterium]
MLLEPIKWEANKIVFIDQTELPLRLKFIKCGDIDTLCEAIKKLKIRGAPLIGVSAALGYALSAINSTPKTSAGLRKNLACSSAKLKATRPTAVNLFWAMRRMEDRFLSLSGSMGLKEIKRSLLKEALSILKEDQDMCRAIGRNGARLVKNKDIILTHCNAGMLATAGHGTALSIFYEAKRQGKKFKVYADETRPLMQGSRLTMWELMKNGIDATLICDDMAASAIKNKGITKIIVGADRIARNGDTANKIGTYGLAILAKYHGIPFYVAAPSSTIDYNIKTGKVIPIEERKREEIIYTGARQTAPLNAKVHNPAFDVTPAGLIRAIITESGVYDIKRFRRI